MLADPFACQQLAHMGADVIKVGARGSGDLARQLGVSRPTLFLYFAEALTPA